MKFISAHSSGRLFCVGRKDRGGERREEGDEEGGREEGRRGRGGEEEEEEERECVLWREHCSGWLE